MDDITFGSEYSRRPIPGQTALNTRAAGEANAFERKQNINDECGHNDEFVNAAGWIECGDCGRVFLPVAEPAPEPCGFCKGQPVGNAATWYSQDTPQYAACPRCGETNLPAEN